jgi:diaminopimelate dehydrogenase
MTGATKKAQVAVIGAGKLGSACAEALIDASDLALAGIVRRPQSQHALGGRLQRFAVVTHVRDLPLVDVVLVCVPNDAALGVTRELLQARIPLVECAALADHELASYYATLDNVAKDHRVTAIIGAGWNPGVLPLFTRAFEILIPHGHSVSHRHPGVNLHHSAVAAAVPGVQGALAGEYRGEDGALQRYVYVELQRGADFDQVSARISADPLFAGESTQIFELSALSELEAQDGQGMVLERHAVAKTGMHASLLLEARFEINAFAARVMLDAVRRIPALHHGAHRYALGI